MKPRAGRTAVTAGASASGSVYSPIAHQSFYVRTTRDGVILGYNVWVRTDNRTDYLDSYVYPDQWMLGERMFEGTVENENTYPDYWTESVRYQIFEPSGALKYDWTQYQFTQQTVFCNWYDHCYLYKRNIVQEYVSKGGAWGNTSTWVSGGPNSIVLQGPQDNPTSRMP